MSNRNRRAGHAWERSFIKKIKHLFKNAVTSRSESRNLDNMGVDVCYTDPFYFQCKTSSKKIDYHAILRNMPDDGHINVIVEKSTKKRGSRFYTLGEYVHLKLDDFIEIIERLNFDKSN